MILETELKNIFSKKLYQHVASKTFFFASKLFTWMTLGKGNSSDITGQCFGAHQGYCQWILLGGRTKTLNEKEKDSHPTGKCFSTSSTSFTRDALGSSKEMATIFQSSSPSSIIAKAASGFTLRTSPTLARLSPISTTSTTEKGHTKN
jgi:hypothetical protein